MFFFVKMRSFVYLVSNQIFIQIDREREGEQIDRALLKNVLDIFVGIGLGNMECYENDFEAAMLHDTASYYSRKATSWIMEDSCPEYMLKVHVFLLIMLFLLFNFFYRILIFLLFFRLRNA